jgi:hypothetical protein
MHLFAITPSSTRVDEKVLAVNQLARGAVPSHARASGRGGVLSKCLVNKLHTEGFRLPADP